MVCPKCGCEFVSHVPKQLIGNMKKTWYLLILCSLFGLIVSPLIIILTITLTAISIALNLRIIVKSRNYWMMQCNRCNTSFLVPNPDRASNIEKARSKQQTAVQKFKDEAEGHRENAGKRVEARISNGKLNENETLKLELPYFSYRVNFFASLAGSLKVSDQAIIWYNANNSFRISKGNIVDVTAINYLGFIQTGVRIKTSEKRKNYDFVVFPKDRKDIIDKIEAVLL